MREERMKIDAATMSLTELATKYGVSKQRIHELIGSVTQYRKRYWGKVGYARRNGIKQGDTVRTASDTAGVVTPTSDDSQTSGSSS